jgi:hypothetical protein
MNTITSSTLAAEVPAYVALQREMHHALRAQHPDWIEADGKSPMCDYYESLFAQLLVSHQAQARAHYDVTTIFSIPVGHAERRNIVFPRLASAIG